MKTYAYGFPRVGDNRLYKKSIEKFWKGKLTDEQLYQSIEEIQTSIINTYSENVDMFPIGEMTFYDTMLDTAIMLNLHETANLSDFYELCRGKNALPMTKWFNTNYHYLQTEINWNSIEQIKPNWNKPEEYLQKYKTGIPYLIGPYTFARLSKLESQDIFPSLLQKLGTVYREFLSRFPEVHIDEPAFVMEVSPAEVELIESVYNEMIPADVTVHLFTYYESVDFLKSLYSLPVHSIGLDFVHSDNNLKYLRENGFPNNKILIAGVISGRNVWRANIAEKADLAKELSQYASNIILSNAGPLYHLPLTTAGEELHPKLLSQLAFAEEKLHELNLISKTLSGQKTEHWYTKTAFGKDQEIINRVNSLQESDFIKNLSFTERKKLHADKFALPLFPTTTIGSFPQTAEVRKYRADYRKGNISPEEYSSFIKRKITSLIELQENLGLDVLVHGEFERTDMVEFFAENLEGIATTKNGWVLSYGTRGYRPPIIYGDVSRPSPMTVNEIEYASSLTGKPVKGMLTGPVTIIAWSFTREDIPVHDVAYQIALCLQDEIRDYEKAGVTIIQIDEPAFRELAPIKKRDWRSYFDWAVRSFNLSSNTDPNSQIHTHMCYSTFGEIIQQIDKMDFDVISIESTRSKGNIIESFENADFQRQIGLGVWDIHSPAVQDIESMKEIVNRALSVIPKENFWINPDCGLKTRGWEESIETLKNLIKTSIFLKHE